MFQPVVILNDYVGVIYGILEIGWLYMIGIIILMILDFYGHNYLIWYEIFGKRPPCCVCRSANMFISHLLLFINSTHII